jgi:acetyl esterase/lipase
MHIRWVRLPPEANGVFLASLSIVSQKTTFKANIIERIFGAKARNSFTRKIFNLQPQPKCPDWLTIRADIMHTVPVRIYEPRRRDESLHGAALVYIHGGGFATLHPGECTSDVMHKPLCV